jgi:hypothetical protein
VCPGRVTALHQEVALSSAVFWIYFAISIECAALMPSALLGRSGVFVIGLVVVVWYPCAVSGMMMLLE